MALEVTVTGTSGLAAMIVAARFRPALEWLAARRWTGALFAAIGAAGIYAVAYGPLPLKLVGAALVAGALTIGKAYAEAGIEPAQLVEPTDPVVAARQDAWHVDTRLEAASHRLPPSL